jgi:hypothetical protein
MLVLIPVSEPDAYVVDISRTRGGSMHDWLLHGSADDDMTARCALEMSDAGTGFAGDEAPRTYEVWRNVRHATANDDFHATFAYDDVPQRGMRVHLLGSAPTELYLGETPSIRRAGVGTRGDNRKVLDFWMPQLAARRVGEAPLHTVFVAVEEPFDGEPFLSRVRRLDVSPPDDDCVALEVTAGGVTDTIISTVDEEPFVERVAGGVTIEGRLGVVRRSDGRVTGMWLFEGRALSADGQRIASDASAYTGAIEGATRKLDGAPYDAFLADAGLPFGDELHGTWIVVTHGNGYRHGYEIDRVEKANGKTTIVLSHDHGLRIGDNATQEVYFPRRTIEGRNTFRIPLAATLIAE